MKRVKRIAKTTLPDILQAAATLFNERGYHQTKLEDIARAVGIEKGSLYHYFDRKEEILYEICREPLQRLVRGARTIAAGVETEEVKIQQAVRHHILLFTTAFYPSLFVLAQERSTNLPEQFRDEFLAMERDYQSIWEGMIQSGVASGALDPDLQPSIAGFAIVGLCNSLHKWYRPQGRLKPEAIADLYAQLVVDGIANRGPAASG